MLSRIETESLKLRHPIELVAARYNVELRTVGRALVGRCPIHQDGGRPNFYVYPRSGSWFCYRCGIGGDVISLVRWVEGVGFRDALERLEAPAPVPPKPLRRIRHHPKESRRPPGRTVAEYACLAAAVELYQGALMADARALGYADRRGIDPATLERCRVGYARGGQLIPYLRWRRLPITAARRVGLLGPAGREFLEGRLVIPEIRSGRPAWLIGRTLTEDQVPKYLGLPGLKPLLGWETAGESSDTFLVEGAVDWLVLRQWGLPALALLGTHVRPSQLRKLTRFRRLYLALDDDEAGREATARLLELLGSRAVSVQLPGVKDVAELATLPDGRELFLQAVDHQQEERAA